MKIRKVGPGHWQIGRIGTWRLAKHHSRSYAPPFLINRSIATFGGVTYDRIYLRLIRRVFCLRLSP